MNKNTVIVVLLIAVAAGIYYWYGHRTAPVAQEAAQVSETALQQEVPQATSSASIGKHAINWKFETVSEDKQTGAIKTKVTVTWDGKSHDAGTYEGSCAEVDGSNGTLSEGEVSGALCWYAGAGDEIGVFSENGSFVLKHGEQQESSGEGEGFRGNFKTLLTL